MRSLSAALLLAILASPPCSGDDPAEVWTTGAGCLLSTAAWSHWQGDRPLVDSTMADAALTATALSPFADLLVTASVTADGDPRPAGLRRLRAALRWPGTPWIGAGVHVGEGAPFVAGLHEPLIESGWIAPDSLRGMSLSAGGFLGFSGTHAMAMQGSDTLVSSRVRSAWLGFAGLDYSRTARYPGSGGPETLLNVLMIRSDFRYVKPWVLVAGAEGEPGRWAVEAELRGIRPFDVAWGRVDVVPGMSFAGDSFSSPGTAFTPGRRVLTLSALLRPERTMIAGAVVGSLDLEGDSLTFVSMRLHMLSEAGLSYDVSGILRENGGRGASLCVGTGSSAASSAFLEADLVDDSVRVTGTVLHAPRPDVGATLSVSGDASGSLDPACALDASMLVGPASGHVGIEWRGGDVLLTVGIGGVLGCIRE